MIKILTFAKGKFIESQNKLNNIIKNIGDYEIINKTDNDLPLSFKEENKHILNHIKGYGYCIWKPYIILEELNKLNDEDILIYIDSTDLPTHNFFTYINNYFIDNDLLLINRGYNNGQWTKRDCFVFMDCDEDKYYKHIQLEAGVIALKKNSFNIKLIEDWLLYCKNENILVDKPNISGKENIFNYKEHRYDQSILTNLSIKHGINSVYLNENIIKYNYNQPKQYN